MVWPGPRDDDLAPDVIGSGSEDSGLLARWPRLARAAGTTRLRWVAAFAVAVAVATVTVVAGGSHHAARPGGGHAGPAITTAPGSTGKAGPGGVFAHGTADGQAWRLAVQDIAGPGLGCVPAVTLNGNDADPVFPGPAALTPVGDPAFVTLGPALPGVGFAFIQVPADIGWVAPGPSGIGPGLRPVSVTTCGQAFRVVGFAYPLTGTLRVRTSTQVYTIPAMFSDPRPTLADPQIDGLWQDVDAAHAQVAIATLASGRVLGQQWSIAVAFGTAGDCFTLSTSYLDDSANAKASQTSFCGPVSTQGGPATIVSLAFGSSAPSGLGTGYAVSVGPGTARLSAELSTGAMLSVTPVVVHGRRYAAFFVPGPPHLTWLNGVDAAGQDVAGVQDLPELGYTQFPL
jgi:hypothetical protein